MELNLSFDEIAYFTSARVAQGGVGKSSRLFFASARWAITACDVFCMFFNGLSYRARYMFTICSDSGRKVKPPSLGTMPFFNGP